VPASTATGRRLSPYQRILLVEDQGSDVELVLAVLSDLHLANGVSVAQDGAEALDYLYCRGKFAGRPDGDPALVLLDINLPRMSGLEVLRQVKADPRLKRVPVVMLTSSRDEPDLARSYELGVNAYVIKPVDFAQFSNAIKELGMFWALVNEPPPATGVRRG
jgi:CheY-like chemotaxis protein